MMYAECEPLPFSHCMESTSYVLSFRMVFFLPCDHGLDFLHNLCENSTNRSKTLNVNRLDFHMKFCGI